MAGDSARRGKPRTPRTPNHVLRDIRENERHETRQQFAEALTRVALEIGEDLYPDEKYVERLESGSIMWPRPPYRNILVTLLGRPMSDLGFTGPVYSASDSGKRDAPGLNKALRDALFASGMEVPQLARKIGVDPKTAQRWITKGRLPHPNHRWKACQILEREESELWPEAYTRKPITVETPDSALSVNVQPNIEDSRVFSKIDPDEEERIIQAIQRPSRIDNASIESFAKILAGQREAEDSIGSAPLIEPVMAHLSVIESLVIQARGPMRPKIVDIAAQWAEFAGWLHTSKERYSEARSLFDRALEWSIESGNTTLAATSLSFKGHVAFLSGQVGPMIGLTQAAQRDSRVWVGQRAYDSYQEARGLALIGDSEEVARKVYEGEELAERADALSDEKPPWIYYYTKPFFALERGLSYRFLGRSNPAYNHEAITSLTSALNELGSDGTSEWAAEYMYHLAIAYMQSDAPENACGTARDVLQIARFAQSERLMNRLKRLHARFADRWPKESNVAEFGELLKQGS